MGLRLLPGSLLKIYVHLPGESLSCVSTRTYTLCFLCSRQSVEGAYTDTTPCRRTQRILPKKTLTTDPMPGQLRPTPTHPPSGLLAPEDKKRGRTHPLIVPVFLSREINLLSLSNPPPNKLVLPAQELLTNLTATRRPGERREHRTHPHPFVRRKER